MAKQAIMQIRTRFLRKNTKSAKQKMEHTLNVMPLSLTAISVNKRFCCNCFFTLPASTLSNLTSWRWDGMINGGKGSKEIYDCKLLWLKVESLELSEVGKLRVYSFKFRISSFKLQICRIGRYGNTGYRYFEIPSYRDFVLSVFRDTDIFSDIQKREAGLLQAAMCRRHKKGICHFFYDFVVCFCHFFHELRQ